MMREMVSARIKAGIKRLAAMVGALASLLLALLFGKPVRSQSSVVSTLVDDLTVALAKAEPESEQDNWRPIAQLTFDWCARSLISGGPQPVSTSIPRFVQVWLQGLTRSECEIICASDKADIIGHIMDNHLIQGVRRIQKLEPSAWPPISPAKPAFVPPADDAIDDALEPRKP